MIPDPTLVEAVVDAAWRRAVRRLTGVADPDERQRISEQELRSALEELLLPAEPPEAR